jgi:hypothetical protein
MSNYTKSTNFASKDSLSTGNALKIVKGTEIDTEFNNIATAIATKQDSGSVTLSNFTIVESGGKLLFKYSGTTVASLDSSGNFVALLNVSAYTTP